MAASVNINSICIKNGFNNDKWTASENKKYWKLLSFYHPFFFPVIFLKIYNFKQIKDLTVWCGEKFGKFNKFLFKPHQSLLPSPLLLTPSANSSFTSDSLNLLSFNFFLNFTFLLAFFLNTISINRIQCWLTTSSPRNTFTSLTLLLY